MSIIMKTAYEWCLELNIRVLDINDWPDELEDSSEKCYFEHEYTNTDFLAALEKVKVKPNSTPRKTLPYLEYRMYGLVPYNISSIQSGIQYGHALQEYNNMLWETPVSDDIVTSFRKWSLKDKTFIILNGGTTNEYKDDRWYGTMQQAKDLLNENEIVCAGFNEPDLNYALTGLVFLVDERVFNRELYPDYVDMPYPWEHKGRGYRPTPQELELYDTENGLNRNRWVEKIGGPKNDFLRTWLRNFRLAS